MMQRFLALEKEWKLIKNQSKNGLLDLGRESQQSEDCLQETHSVEITASRPKLTKISSLSHTRAPSIKMTETPQSQEDSSTSAALFESPELKNFLSQNDESRRNSSTLGNSSST